MILKTRLKIMCFMRLKPA